MSRHSNGSLLLLFCLLIFAGLGAAGAILSLRTMAFSRRAVLAPGGDMPARAGGSPALFLPVTGLVLILAALLAAFVRLSSKQENSHGKNKRPDRPGPAGRALLSR